MKYLVFDLETGGLDPDVHGITEIAAVVMEHTAWRDAKVVDEVHRVVCYEQGRQYEVQALELQHRTLSDLEQGGQLGTAIGDLRAMVCRHLGQPKRCAPWAHNAAFDMVFMQEACDRNQIQMPFNRLYRCSSVLFRVLGDLGVHDQIYSSRLDMVVDHYGITIDEARRHTALGDAEATGLAIARMMGELGARREGLPAMETLGHGD